MQAYEIHEAFGLENLRLVSRAHEAVGAHDVRVQLRAVSLNYRDVLTVQGLYNPKQRLPLVPCSDGAGVVKEIGSEVTRFKVGDRVIPNFAQRWLSGAPQVSKIRPTLGGPLDGTLRTEAVFNEQGLVAMPSHLSFEEAATLPCAALTAWSALSQVNLQSGETLLIQGTGGVAIFALQFAKLRGARVVITSKSEEKLARAKTLGADITINYMAVPTWGRAARDVTRGEGVDAVLEVGGGETLEQSIQALKPGGSIALIGVLSGTHTSLSLTPILMQNLRIQGVLVGHREQFEAMNRAIELHALRPVIGETHAFSNAIDAFERMMQGAHFGKIVIAIPAND
jgi:NADPH:quinone reductase-like Zn-dependent oxidoreductase